VDYHQLCINKKNVHKWEQYLILILRKKSCEGKATLIQLFSFQKKYEMRFLIGTKKGELTE
jgi:hypothetical protein